MSHIRAEDTRPEMLVRRWLWAEGYRYRLHVKTMPGKPDIVMRKWRTAIFINGCFWHGHNIKRENGGLVDSECCRIPHTRREFWAKKITRNADRDAANITKLQAAGWQVIVIWECTLKPARRMATLNALSLQLSRNILERFGVKRRAAVPLAYPEPTEENRTMAAEDELPYGGTR